MRKDIFSSYLLSLSQEYYHQQKVPLYLVVRMVLDNQRSLTFFGGKAKFKPLARTVFSISDNWQDE